MTKKAYISGAISGLPFDQVIIKFREAEEHLIKERLGSRESFEQWIAN